MICPLLPEKTFLNSSCNRPTFLKKKNKKTKTKGYNQQDEAHTLQLGIHSSPQAGASCLLSLPLWPPQTMLPLRTLPCLFSPCSEVCKGLHRAGGASQHPHGPGRCVLCQSPADPDMLHCHSPSCRREETRVLGTGQEAQARGRAEAKVLTNLPQKGFRERAQ